ncbi:MAG: ester cyclase [Anaerolineae bacterium]|nr:ester cyclase [Anaerolineae bacterium]
MPASLIRLILESAFNQGDLSAVEELLTPDSITHIPAWGLPHSRTGLQQLIASLRLAFPDLHCALEDEIREGERCAAHWTVRGTHTGLFLGNPATGKPIVAQSIIFARTADGRIVEGWLLIDQFGILQQLGIVPPPRG